MRLRYFSHSAFQVTTADGRVILIDPFLTGNPTAPCSADDIAAHYIVLSHAHSDHLGDALAIAKRCNAVIIAVNELANYCADKGCTVHNMHIGGGYDFPFGRVEFTIAHHGSSTPEGDYAGEPAGILLTAGGKTIYHTGDTGLFMDMQLIGERHSVDCLLVPIGGNFTMNGDDAIKAAELTNAALTIPMHYDTFPVIKADPQEFVKKLAESGRKGLVLAYGEEIAL